MPLTKTQQTNGPLVSFLLPVYNCEEFLTETLHSLIEQTYTNFEVVAIDDGSSDGSLAILEKYATFDSRIRVIKHEKNMGLSPTLNDAIREAKGELLARIDTDDLCVPRRLEWQVEEMEKDKTAVLCYGFYEYVSGDGEYLGRDVRPLFHEDMARLLYTRNAIAHATVMLRKSLLPEQLYRDDVGPTEDFEFWTRLIQANNFVCAPHVIMRYRINTNGIMHTVGHLQWDNMKRNFDAYWGSAGLPKVLSPLHIRRRMHANLDAVDGTTFGSDIVRFMLDGESQLAMKCIKRGHIGLGLKIFLCTAASSRTGLKACIKRIVAVVSGAIFPSSQQKQDQEASSESSQPTR